MHLLHYANAYNVNEWIVHFSYVPTVCWQLLALSWWHTELLYNNVQKGTAHHATLVFVGSMQWHLAWSPYLVKYTTVSYWGTSLGFLRNCCQEQIVLLFMALDCSITRKHTMANEICPYTVNILTGDYTGFSCVISTITSLSSQTPSYGCMR